MKFIATTCEYLPSPIGLDAARPRFGWALASDRREVIQASYRVHVASAPDLLDVGKSDLWDSGHVESDRSVNIEYSGNELASGQKCWWTVAISLKVGSQVVEEITSDPASFEMGLLNQSDWQGDWIAAPEDVGAPLMRKVFTLSESAVDARAYICGLGWYELYINGIRVGDQVLDPAMTNYNKRSLYATHDVTELLQPGENVVGVILGHAWFSEPDFTEQPVYLPQMHYGPCPQMILQLNAADASGNAMSIVSDQSWKTSPSPITRNDLFGGETYDARLEQRGWATSEFNDEAWAPVRTVESRTQELSAQVMPPLRVMQTYDPCKLDSPSPDRHIYHFEKYFSGWVRFKVKAPAGTKVTIKYSGRLDDETGELDVRNYPEPRETDYYICRGDPDGETFEPRFTFHPVRYVQITGLPYCPDLNDVQGCFVHSDYDFSAEFSCSNDLLNRIHGICNQTLRIAAFGMLLDCLCREHWAFLDPASVSSALFGRQYQPLFWEKWMRDVADAQNPDGSLLCVVPRYMDADPGDPAWAGNYPMAIWYNYMAWDDKRLLEEHYEPMKRFLDQLTSMSTDGLVSGGSLGDHMVPGPEPGKEEFLSRETPPELLWTAYYYRCTTILARAAAELGHSDQALHFNTMATTIKDSLNHEWLDEDHGRYATGSQTCNLVPLALDIVPSECRDAVIADIVDNITNKHDTHLHTGTCGTPALLEALTRAGQGERMFRIMTQTTYPGWGYMVDQGATTVWECWGRYWSGCTWGDRVGRRADSMPMWAGATEFMIGDLAGIQGPGYFRNDCCRPGYAHVAIAPNVLGDVTWARASILTTRGRIASNWRLTQTGISLEVQIPANATARITVPVSDAGKTIISEQEKTVWEHGAFVHGVEGILSGASGDDAVCFEVGSGHYTFETKEER